MRHASHNNSCTQAIPSSTHAQDSTSDPSIESWTAKCSLLFPLSVRPARTGRSALRDGAHNPPPLRLRNPAPSPLRHFFRVHNAPPILSCARYPVNLFSERAFAPLSLYFQVA